MHASSRHPSFTALRLGVVAALLITAALFASQAMAEPAGSDLRSLQSGRLDAGGAHTCAIYNGGSVRCWGEAAAGQLGYGSTTDIGDSEAVNTAGPVNLGVGRTAVALAAGTAHTCAILDNGTVRCWGEGADGRLGYGNTNKIGDDETPNTAGPVNLGTGRTAVAITAGDKHTCALLDNGTVRCWGKGDFGRLGYGNADEIGDNETPNTAGPVFLGFGRTAVAIAAGVEHTCAILNNGSVRCWGEGAAGRLGYGNTNDIGDDDFPGFSGPVSLGTGRTAVAITAGDHHTCAVLDNGTVRCWGDAANGRVGYGNATDIGDDEAVSTAGPVDLGAGRTALAITAGSAHTCAVLDNNTLRCWGEGDLGRLGYANQSDIGDNEVPGSVGPVNLGAGRTAVVVTAGTAHTCSVLDDGTVRCWGDAAAGRVGYGNLTDIGDDEAPGTAGPVTLGGTVSTQGPPPTAVNDSATVAEDSGATAVDVLANDVDSEGWTKTIQSTSDPANGTVVITGGGTGLTYQPDPNHCNNPPGTPDTFTYTLNGGSTATISVTVNCVDDNPTAVNDSATMSEDAPPTPIDVLANDTDVDGGPKTISSASDPANGSVVLIGGSAGAHTGLTYQPDPNYCNDPPGGSPDTFTYTINGGSAATVSVTVNCIDDNPTAADDPATMAEDAGATAIDVLANDTDTDGGPKTISSADDPANGTVVLTGGSPGAHTGLTYQPDPNYCNNPPSGSPDTFTYTINGDSTATVSVTVNCLDDSPTAVNDSATVAKDAPATAIDVLANDTDTDGGPRNIQSASDPANGTVVVTGGGTGLTYQPDPIYCNDAGPTDDFTYSLNGGSTATVSMSVSCTDDPPTAVDDAATIGESDPATAVDVLANDTDPDGGPKQIQSVTQPADGNVVITGGGSGVTYEPGPGYCNDGGPTDDFTYTLNGGSTATVSMTVTCVDDPPAAVDNSATVVEDASATAIDVLANDTDPDGGPRTISLASGPANGTVVLTGGSPGEHTGLTYQPDPNYCNSGSPTDNFTYTVNGGSEATVSVTVTCVDDLPVAVGDSATVNEDDPATVINMLANDTDVDGGPKTVSSAGDPANGTVVLTGGSPGAHTGLTYQPDPGYCNDGGPTDDFTYSANGGSTATVAVAVNCLADLIPPNNPPGSNNAPSVTTPDGQRLDVHRMLVPRSVGKLARKGIKLQVTCRIDCQVVVRVSVSTEVMRVMGLKKPLIASGSAPGTAGRQTWVAARLNRRARAAMLRYGGGGRLQVDVRALSPNASTAVLHLD